MRAARPWQRIGAL